MAGYDISRTLVEQNVLTLRLRSAPRPRQSTRGPQRSQSLEEIEVGQSVLSLTLIALPQNFTVLTLPWWVQDLN